MKITDQQPIINNQQPKIWRDLLWLTAVVLLIQAFWASRLTHPSYFDAYYYTTNGQRLADGYGFTEEIIWQYLDDPAGLPTPSLTYWMPLPAIIAAIGYSVNDSFRAAQFPFWLMAGLLPLMSYFISWRLSGALHRCRRLLHRLLEPTLHLCPLRLDGWRLSAGAGIGSRQRPAPANSLAHRRSAGRTQPPGPC